MAERELIELLNAYIERIVLFITPKEILLYGSMSRGNAHEGSDIDVAVIVDEAAIEATGLNFLQISAELYRLCEDIDWRIEPILLEENKDPSGFLAQIKSSGRVLYKAA